MRMSQSGHSTARCLVDSASLNSYLCLVSLALRRRSFLRLTASFRAKRPRFKVAITAHAPLSKFREEKVLRRPGDSSQAPVDLGSPNHRLLLMRPALTDESEVVVPALLRRDSAQFGALARDAMPSLWLPTRPGPGTSGVRTKPLARE